MGPIVASVISKIANPNISDSTDISRRQHIFPFTLLLLTFCLHLQYHHIHYLCQLKHFFSAPPTSIPAHITSIPHHPSQLPHLSNYQSNLTWDEYLQVRMDQHLPQWILELSQRDEFSLHLTRDLVLSL